VLEVGKQAPDFTLSDQEGNSLSLSDLKGRRVVLYFYPRASTPGCTTQACGVRDSHSSYSEQDVTVLGVSPDPVAKVKKFHDAQHLNFTLLADEDHAVAEQYGTWVEKSMYGRKYWGVERTTFIIGTDGTVESIFKKVRPKEHDSLVLKALSAQ